MTNFNLSLAVLVLGVFASQSRQAEAQCTAAMAALPANSNCSSCTTANCVWCNGIVVSARDATGPITLPTGVCAAAGSDCTGVGTSEAWAADLNRLVGDFNYDGKVVNTLTHQFMPFTGCPLPTTTGILTVGATGASNCLRCQAVNGNHCKLSIGADASTEVKTSALCFSDDTVCAAFAITSPQLYTSTQQAPAGCAGFADATDLVAIPTCRSFDNCAACKAASAPNCSWCQASVQADNTQSLQEFGKCVAAAESCDPFYQAIRPIADFYRYPTGVVTQWVDPILNTIATGAACTALPAVDRAALSGLVTPETCTAVTGFVWCELELLDSGASGFGAEAGVCANDAATCTAYTVANSAGLGLSATPRQSAVVPSGTPSSTTTTTTSTTSAAATKAVGTAALLSVVVAMIWM